MLFFCYIYRTILLTYKHKTHAVDSVGKIMSNADVDFYIEDVCLLSFNYHLFVYESILNSEHITCFSIQFCF